MTAPGSAYGRLHAYLHQTRLLGSISSALYYDQNTVMPAAGAPWRGEQLALRATQLHQRQSQQEYVDLVAGAEAELQPESPPESHRNLQLLRLELERQRCLDPEHNRGVEAAQTALKMAAVMRSLRPVRRR